MGQAAGEVILLEAMEATTHASPEFARTGDLPTAGTQGDTEPQRLLADDSKRTCADRAEQPSA